jgi:homoserine/homoserine lactone efflux protein
MDLSVWLTFFVASWAISVSPGAGAVAAMSAGLNHGFARGYMMTIGLVLGILVQVAVVGLGLGALIAASSLAYSLVKWLGVAYLVFLGIKQWRAPAVPMVSESANGEAASARQLILRGLAINTANPKTTVFLLAVVPQFLDLGHALAPQYAIIGATISFTDLVVMAGYTALAAKVLRLLKSARQIKAMNRTFGSLFVAAGLLLASIKRA